MIKQIPRLLGPGLNKAGKFPTLIGPNDNLETKVSLRDYGRVFAGARTQCSPEDMRSVICGLVAGSEVANTQP